MLEARPSLPTKVPFYEALGNLSVTDHLSDPNFPFPHPNSCLVLNLPIKSEPEKPWAPHPQPK